MKYLVILLIFINSAFSSEYYAKLEPIHSYVVKSSVSGKVLFSNDEIEGFIAKKSKIIEIESIVENIELKQVNEKLELIKKMIKIEDKNYKRLKKVKTKSAFEKDAQFLKSLNLQSSQSELLSRQAILKNTIKNKNLSENNKYVYNINVKKDDYVTPGTLLYETKDLSKGKLEIFVPINEIDTVNNKTIYLNKKQTNLKVDKIYKIADSKHISSYKVEIIVPNPETFSRLIKIEFK